MTSELAELAKELEASSRSLAESREREAALETARRELVSWISHDLRTPLASMRAMTEALEDGMASDVQGYYRKIIGQTEQMTAMVNDLSELSKIQAGTLRLRSEPLDLYDLVSDALSDLAPLAAKRGIRLDGGGGNVSAWPSPTDQAWPGQCGTYSSMPSSTPSQAATSISVSDGTASDGGGPEGKNAGNAVIAVHDQCGGIPDEDLPHLFETGWQKDPARRTSEALQAATAGGPASVSAWWPASSKLMADRSQWTTSRVAVALRCHFRPGGNPTRVFDASRPSTHRNGQPPRRHDMSTLAPGTTKQRRLTG